MQVVFHLGAPCTDGDQLVLSLLKNRLRLAQSGICVPPPGRYRAVIRDTSRALKGLAANDEVQEGLLDAIIGDAPVERLVMSDPRFVCINRLVVQGAQVWPMIDRVTQQLRSLFPHAQVSFFIGMRDPATLIPALFKASRFSDFEEFIQNMQPLAVTWSEMLRRLSNTHPDCPITVWCNEDTPLLWADIMRSLAGVGPETPLDGMNDLAETIMDDAGFARMLAWFDEHPGANEDQRKRVLAAFLERYALPNALEETLNLPQWTDELVAALSRNYDEDVATIPSIPNVRLLMP